MILQVGDKVQKGQVICIIEAMKLMNEIEVRIRSTIFFTDIYLSQTLYIRYFNSCRNNFQADLSGTVEQILVEDGKPVSVDLVTSLSTFSHTAHSVAKNTYFYMFLLAASVHHSSLRDPTCTLLQHFQSCNCKTNIYIYKFLETFQSLLSLIVSQLKCSVQFFVTFYSGAHYIMGQRNSVKHDINEFASKSSRNSC